ncbi:MAG: hypothetical protein [Caudoviricetes sp.]|nr:MAG: hypothetical protein [Caudoviricetes sp.]
MKTTVNATEQLTKIITSTDEKVLSEKLNKYFLGKPIKTESLMNTLLDKLDLLEELKDLIQEMQSVTVNYNFDVVYDNDQDFWDNRFDDPYEAVEAIGTDYNFGDDYVYINGDASINSCSSLSEFYNNSVIEEVTKQIAADLKDDTTEIIDNMDFSIQDLLLKIFK